MNSNTLAHPTMSKKFLHSPIPTISKKVAADLSLDYPLAKRLVDVYVDRLYQDVAGHRVRSGSRSSQILLGLAYTKLAHLQQIAVDDTHIHNHLVNCILSAAGYVRAVGGDAISLQMLS